jgi:Flp pilus assembly CpaE family ATPase
LDNARRIAEVAIVDCGFSVEVDEEVMYDTQAPRRNGATLAVLEQADTVLAVGAADPVGLSRLVRAIGDLRDAVPASDPVVVVNRLRESMGWTSDDVAATVRRTTDVADVVCLPNDPRSCDRALLAGETLVEAAPEGRLTRSLRELSARLTGLPAASSARSSWNRRPRRQGRKSSHRPVSV